MIIKATPDEKMAETIHGGNLLPDLNKSQEFVRIFMEGGLSFTAVESIETLESKLRKQSTSRLLQG